MAVQDLTPQLRTRLSRVERVVGVFVTLASLLLLAGFGYYVYHTGVRKGWWVHKFPYHTFVDSATGLGVETPVTLLGFEVGRVTKVTALDPEQIIYGDYGNVYIEFVVREPYQGYIWTDSKVKVSPSDLLGKRSVQVLPGGETFKTDPGAAVRASYQMTNGTVAVYHDEEGEYVPLERDAETKKGYWLPAIETAAITERLEFVANQVQAALPGILDLTNRLNLVLSNAAATLSEAQSALITARPALSNVAVITANITDPKGSLGEWILPTNLNVQLVQTLANANTTLTNLNRTVANTDSNVTMLATNLDVTLVNLANITSNLNEQVQSNTNLVKSLSDLIINANEMMEGLKRHWLLRSAFKKKDEEKKEDRDQSRRRTPPPRAGKWRDYP
jgi:hypothetical protein